ncbi:MAG: alpha/beta hydrolase [Promethearchaeota archaeon]
MEISNHLIMPDAGPFYFEGNKIGILLIHGGGGGTCSDLKPLAKDLHIKEGYTISIPLLPGYGTTPDELRKIRIDDWKSTIKEEISVLSNKCEKILVGGHSMGGILTLLLAAENNLDCIFTINAPVGIQRFLFHFVPIFKIFVKYHSINSEQFKKDTNGKWVGYDKIPLNIATKMKRLMKEMKRSLININCPTLLFQGRRDSEIKVNSMDYIFNNINSKRKRKIWLENNGHPILESPDHNQIVIEVIKFINEFCP